MKKVLIGLGILVSLLVVVATALPTILHAAGLHPIYQGPSVALPGKRALICLLYTSPSPRDGLLSRMPSSA